eukprot:1500097-Lingulodinium_polyedra.AAC.1
MLSVIADLVDTKLPIRCAARDNVLERVLGDMIVEIQYKVQLRPLIRELSLGRRRWRRLWNAAVRQRLLHSPGHAWLAFRRHRQ